MFQSAHNRSLYQEINLQVQPCSNEIIPIKNFSDLYLWICNPKTMGTILSQAGCFLLIKEWKP